MEALLEVLLEARPEMCVCVSAHIRSRVGMGVCVCVCHPHSPINSYLCVYVCICMYMYANTAEQFQQHKAVRLLCIMKYFVLIIF